jgi:molybdate transport system substrate-binding protein
VAPLPSEIQSYVTFSAGVSVDSNQAGAAKDLIQFLTGPIAIPVIKSQGMEPLGKSVK